MDFAGCCGAAASSARETAPSPAESCCRMGRIMVNRAFGRSARDRRHLKTNRHQSEQGWDRRRHSNHVTCCCGRRRYRLRRMGRSPGSSSGLPNRASRPAGTVGIASPIFRPPPDIGADECMAITEYLETYTRWNKLTTAATAHPAGRTTSGRRSWRGPSPWVIPSAPHARSVVGFGASSRELVPKTMRTNSPRWLHRQLIFGRACGRLRIPAFLNIIGTKTSRASVAALPD